MDRLKVAVQRKMKTANTANTTWLAKPMHLLRVAERSRRPEISVEAWFGPGP